MRGNYDLLFVFIEHC